MKKLLSLILSLILILGLCGCTLDEYFRFSPENNDSDDEEKITEQPDSNANKVFPIYDLKEIESIVFDTKGRPVAEALEAFYRDVNYVYYFPNIISQYVIVTYTDKTTENVKEALENLHIKISDLDRFGIKYEKWEDGSVEKIVVTTESGDDAIETFYESENYIYQFARIMSHNVIVYYNDGTSENIKEALESGRISITLLDWFGIKYSKVQKAPKLTLSKLKYLVSKYGEDLNWRHFELFYYVETGSGLYIREYPIDHNYHLMMGGGNTSADPIYIYLVSMYDNDEHIDVRKENMDDFLDSNEYLIEVPEDFSFSLTFGTFGVSSYDSETGRLVKTTDATNPEDYVTTHILRPWEREYMFKLLMSLGAGYYPDEYNPSDSFSEPSQTIILTVHILDFDKTIKVEDISLFYDYRDDDGKRFIDTINSIVDILVSTEEWKALPDYENLYE